MRAMKNITHKETRKILRLFLFCNHIKVPYIDLEARLKEVLDYSPPINIGNEYVVLAHWYGEPKVV